MDSLLQKIKLKKNKVNPLILKMQDNVKGGDKNKDTRSLPESDSVESKDT